jgi:aminomuconate-semialdehyde/2-hydroxymuconate-6-semialdehyde dehydrogenase
MHRIENYVDGKLRAPRDGKYLKNWRPSTGAVYSEVPDSSPEDVRQAVAAAEKALPAWSALPVERRASYLKDIARAIERRAPELAAAESDDTGKPLSLAAAMDIPRSAQNFRFFAEAVAQFSSECHPDGESAFNYTLRRPVGVVGCISPWNLPLYLLSWKIAPALAMGNCVVAKPSELTPMTAELLSKICVDVGLPAGVLNIVHGRGPEVGAALVSHPRVGAISFTGSTATGAAIAALTAPSFKKVALEMGGKNPSIVFSDCDFEEAAAGVARSAFLNQGQICLCGSRILIEKKIYKKFRNALVKRAKALVVGDPSQKVDQGALVSAAHFKKVSSAVTLAKRSGGRVLCGGGRPKVDGACKNGWFFSPTLIEGLSNQHRFNQDEIFGPVASLIPFEGEKEALSLANGTKYGLAATLWTKDLKRAHRVAARLESGIVWVNCWLLRDLRTPFGGVKQSGLGREGGHEALRFFSEPKNVCIKL